MPIAPLLTTTTQVSNNTVAIQQNSSATQSTQLDTATPATRIEPPSLSRERTIGQGQLEQTASTGANQDQKQPSPSQVGIIQDKQSEKTIVQNQVASSVDNTVRTSNGTTNGTTSGNSNEPDIREKVMAYLHGNKEDLTIRDMEAAFKNFPDLKGALLARMMGGEPHKEPGTDAAPTAATSAGSTHRDGGQPGLAQSNPLGITSPTPVNPSANSTGGSENAIGRSGQAVRERRILPERELWVPPHLRGRRI